MGAAASRITRVTASAAAATLIACSAPPGAPPDGLALDGDAALPSDATTDALPRSDAGPPDAALERFDAGAVDPPDASTPPPFEAEGWHRSVIYLVLTDRFANGDPSNDGDETCFDPASPTRFHGGDFTGLRQRLDYLQELGVDTVWITPIARQVPRRGESCGYHGYWADLDDPDDATIEPRLGSDADLDALIDAMHARGMKLILDQVVNHPGRNARIVTTRPDWFHPAAGCDQLGDAEVYCSLNGLPDFAQERADVAAYLDRHSTRWIARFDFDGIRMDTVKHVPLAYFTDHWVPAVRGVRPSLYLIGEIFDEGSYAPQLRYRPAGFHGFFDFPLRRAMIDSFARGGSANGVAARVREAVSDLGPEAVLLKSNILDNHDVTRFPGEIPATAPANVQRDRFRLALGLAFTTPGIPQLYYGTELGMSGAYPENRRDMPAWAFDPATRSGPRAGFLGDPGETFSFVQRLIALRRQTPCLHAGGYAELWRPGGSAANLYAFFRSRGDSRAIVAINAGDEPVTGLRMGLSRNGAISAEDKAALPEQTVLREVLGTAAGAAARIEAGEIVVTLPPRSTAVWVAP